MSKPFAPTSRVQSPWPTWKYTPPHLTQQPARLRNPAIRVGPDRCAVLGECEVEARIRERHGLAARLHERELEPVLTLEHTRRLELRRRGVDADRPRAAASQPR